MENIVQEELELTYNDDYMKNRKEIEKSEYIDFYFLCNIDVSELKEEIDIWLRELIKIKEQKQCTSMEIICEEIQDEYGNYKEEYYLVYKKFETKEEYESRIVKEETEFEYNFESNLKLVMAMPKEQKNKFISELIERDGDFGIFVK